VQPGSLVRVFGIRQPVTGTWLAPATVALIALLAGAQIAQGAPRVATQALDLSRHHGRVVIVDFWASWCKPCRQSIPWLNTLKARYGADGLTIIGVNVDAEREDADRFLRDVPIDFEVMFDPDGDVARHFRVQGMPTSYVIDRSGQIVATHLGFREAKKGEIESAIKALLDAPIQ
jgi:cytochrome c biogenesis protein CcmG/thiol:disulfide interchange protein DsbE